MSVFPTRCRASDGLRCRLCGLGTGFWNTVSFGGPTILAHPQCIGTTTQLQAVEVRVDVRASSTWVELPLFCILKHCMLICLATGPSRFLPKSTRFFFQSNQKALRAVPKIGVFGGVFLQIFCVSCASVKIFSRDRNRRPCNGG